MIRLSVIAIMLLLIITAQASSFRRPTPYETETLGYSCANVRTAIETIGRVQLEAMGKAYGITPQQRREANKCLARRSRQQIKD